MRHEKNHVAVSEVQGRKGNFTMYELGRTAFKALRKRENPSLTDAELSTSWTILSDRRKLEWEDAMQDTMRTVKMSQTLANVESALASVDTKKEQEDMERRRANAQEVLDEIRFAMEGYPTRESIPHAVVAGIVTFMHKSHLFLTDQEG